MKAQQGAWQSPAWSLLLPRSQSCPRLYAPQDMWERLVRDLCRKVLVARTGLVFSVFVICNPPGIRLWMEAVHTCAPVLTI